jgi:hypothetical protein
VRKVPQIVAAVSGLVVAAVVGVVLTQHADAAAVPVYHPTRLTHLGDAHQVVVVTGA